MSNWTSRTIRPIGCVVLLLLLCHPAVRAQADDTHGLVLRGKVVKIQTDSAVVEAFI